MKDKNTTDIFRKCMEKLPMPIIIVGADEKVIFLNQSYGDFLGIRPEDAVGRHVYEIIENSRTPLLLKTQKAEYADRHTYVSGKLKGQEIIVHRIPIVENGKSLAVFGLLMFTSIEDLMALAEQNQKINDELHFYKKNFLELQNSKYSLDNILGSSRVIEKLKEDIVKVATVRQTVLITGESGVGKELIAHSIHNCSERHERMFVRVNCAAIPDQLFESEFFGYMGGSFSGASKTGKVGMFELANGGTLFLDEIGELPLFMQSKLLRVLQEKEVTRVGGTKTIPVDVRIVAATNRNLEKMVQQGKFREDLYYRINIINIKAPSLREHLEDIDILSDKILDDLFQENGVKKTLSQDVREAFRKYSWPGNVRELTNILSKMYYMSATREMGILDLPVQLSSNADIPKCCNNKGMNAMIEELEEKMVSQVMKENDNNVLRAAEILGISRARLYRILKRIEQSESGVSE